MRTNTIDRTTALDEQTVFERLAGYQGDDSADPMDLVDRRTVQQAIDAQLLAIEVEEADFDLGLMDDDELEAFIADVAEWPEAG